MECIKHFFLADHTTLAWWEMCLRGVFTYLFTILVMRLGNQRALGSIGISDIAFVILFGSLISRGITGNASFLATLGTCLSMAILHKYISYLSFRSRTAGKLFKGQAVVIVKDGRYLYDTMRQHQITEEDVKEAMRLDGNIENIQKVKEAVFERCGRISIVK